MFTFDHFAPFNFDKINQMIEPGKIPALSAAEKDAVIGHSRGKLTHLLEYVGFSIYL